MKREDDGFFDLEIDLSKMIEGSSAISEVLALKDLQQRKLFINEEIAQDTIADIVKNILQYNKDDRDIEPEKRKPIYLYVVSNGGDVDSGFELIDIIRASKTPVYTINLGYQYSMGFLIGIAGHKRYATQNSKFLIHDGSNFIYNSGAKAQDEMDFHRKVEDRIKQYIISATNISAKEYDKKLRVEWYMFADEAKERGIVDYIIGVDCGIDEVI